MSEAQKQIALVTGASRGIGASIALHLAQQGFVVIGTATSDDGAAKISQALSAFPGSRGANLNVNDAAAGESLIVAGFSSGRNAGTYADTLSVSAGANTVLSNYAVTIVNGGLTITPYQLHFGPNGGVGPRVVGAANDKVYDAGTTATGGVSVLGLLGTDTLSATATSATFDTKDVGTGKAVTFAGISLGGDATTLANYTLGSTTTLGATAATFTDWGLIPGEWVWIGGDAAGEKFATAANNGFYRIKTIAAKSIVFDRSPNSPVTDTGTGKTIRVFFGHVIKNEQAADIVARTYQLERKLTSNNYEYLLGAMPNVLALDIKTADKITIDLSFVAMDGDTETVAKSGNRPDLPSGNFAFNSSSDFTRLRLLDDTAGGSLATYLQDLKLTIDNGVTPAKAIGTIGSIDLTPGDFMVNGTVEAYFSTLTAVDAVRANDDVSLDFALVAKNLGWLFDVPLITLGDARLKVEKDKPIILPLSLDAAAHETLDHTLLVVYYTYLPSAAQ